MHANKPHQKFCLCRVAPHCETVILTSSLNPEHYYFIDKGRGGGGDAQRAEKREGPLEGAPHSYSWMIELTI